MNLYLYIPPGSAHPKNMLYGLVYGRLRAYRLQNTRTDDFVKMSLLLGKRLCARGYSLHTLLPIFKKASEKLLLLTQYQILYRTPLLEPPPADTTVDEDKPLIFHIEHHPRGITRQQICAAYSETIGPLITDRNLIIAVSRPKNIRDRVCSTRLYDIPGDNPSDHIDTGDNTRSPQILPRR
jgi:hypothetical protein